MTITSLTSLTSPTHPTHPTTNLFRFIICISALLCSLANAQSLQAGNNQNLSLLAAAKAGNSQTAIILLDGASNINFPESDGTTALHWAVLNNDLALAQALVRSDASINIRSRYDITPIYLAAMNGNPEMMALLLNADANPNEEFKEGETVLMTASRTGNYESVKLLLEQGAQIDATENWHGQTALMWAVAQGQANLIPLLVEHGAQVNTLSAQELWERQTTDEPRAKWLPTGEMSPLLFAAREGCLDCIVPLIALGADINKTTPIGISPLLISLINGHYDVAWSLIQAGANVNIVDDTARSPLYAAVDFNIMPESNRPAPSVTHNEHTTFEIIELLLEKGALVNRQLTSQAPYRLKLDRGTDGMLTAGTSAFLRAAKSADIKAMNLLLAYQADPFLFTRAGINPLMTAANLGTTESDTTGRYKSEEQMIQAIQICLDLGLDINAKSDAGRTAIFGAAQFGKTEVIQFLHDNGAILDYVDSHGLSPIDAAMGKAGGYGFTGSDGVVHEESATLIQALL